MNLRLSFIRRFWHVLLFMSGLMLVIVTTWPDLFPSRPPESLGTWWAFTYELLAHSQGFLLALGIITLFFGSLGMIGVIRFDDFD